MAVNWLRERLRERSINQKHLAKHIGVDEGVFSHYLILNRHPSMTFVDAVAKALELEQRETLAGLAETYAHRALKKGRAPAGVTEDRLKQYFYRAVQVATPFNLMDGMGLVPPTEGKDNLDKIKGFDSPDVDAQPLTQPPVILPALDGIPPVVPVMGTARGGVNGAFELNHGDPIAFIKRRPGVAGSPKAYALYVEGDSMEPRYFAGETIHIDPSRKVRPGDFVLVEQKFDEHDVPQAFIKRLVRRTATKVVVEQYNPPKTIDMPIKTVVTLDRVLLSNEVDGV